MVGGWKRIIFPAFNCCIIRSCACDSCSRCWRFTSKASKRLCFSWSAISCIFPMKSWWRDWVGSFFLNKPDELGIGCNSYMPQKQKGEPLTVWWRMDQMIRRKHIHSCALQVAKFDVNIGTQQRSSNWYKLGTGGTPSVKAGIEPGLFNTKTGNLIPNRKLWAVCSVNGKLPRITTKLIDRDCNNSD